MSTLVKRFTRNTQGRDFVIGDVSTEKERRANTSRDGREAVVQRYGYLLEDTDCWYGLFRGHITRSDRRGLRSELTFEDYVRKAYEANLSGPEMIGARRGMYQLGRVGDEGNYTNGNCRFITREQNTTEAHANGRLDNVYTAARGQTKETSEHFRKISLALKGRTAENDPRVATMAAKLRGRTKETHDHLLEHSKRMSGRTKQTHSGVALSALKKSNRFIVKDPNGVIYTGVNLGEFCDGHGLNRSHMSAVCRGDKDNHKGWVGYYPTDFGTTTFRLDENDVIGKTISKKRKW